MAFTLDPFNTPCRELEYDLDTSPRVVQYYFSPACTVALFLVDVEAKLENFTGAPWFLLS